MENIIGIIKHNKKNRPIYLKQGDSKYKLKSLII